MKYLVLLVTLMSLNAQAQHSISGTLSPASEYSYAFLYHATPTSSDYVDRAELDANGQFTIPLDSTVAPGIYKIVYALPPEDNNFDLIYNGKENISLTFSPDKGLAFTDSNENKLWSSYSHSMDMINQTISNYYAQESNDKKGYKDIIKTLKDTQAAFDEASTGTLAETFIKSNTPYIPKDYEDLSTYSANLKRTFLDHVDFNNHLLQSSDFIIDRVLAFIFGMSANTSNDVYKKDVDTVMSKIGEGELVLKTMLMQMIWSRFKNMDNPEVANYISDAYLMDLSKATNFDALTEQLVAYKNNAIGNKAQNFEFAYNDNGKTINTTLHDIAVSDQYLVVFWSSSCGHCLDELPKLKSLMASHQEVKVIAIGLEDGADEWQKLVGDYPDFIHVLGLGKWDNPISNAYDVSSTPTLVLLDKDKTITAKPYDVEALKNILNN